MTDYHVHIGQYNKTYFYPDRVVESLALCGISECWLSSTTSCIFCKEKHPELQDNPTAREIQKAVFSEIKAAINTGKEFGVKVNPLYWIVPDFEDCGIKFEECLSKETSFEYKGFKIHPRAQNWDLSDSKTFALAKRVFAFAEKNNLRILIHTGIDECDSPQKFEPLIKLHPNCIVQLAHYKDEEATKYMLKNYSHIIADNSTNKKKSVDNKRIFFGSDFPCVFFDTSIEYDYSTKELKTAYSTCIAHNTFPDERNITKFYYGEK